MRCIRDQTGETPVGQLKEGIVYHTRKFILYFVDSEKDIKQ